MINNLKGFFSSAQHWPLKGWELPLTGLLLTAGLTATVSTLKTTAPPKTSNTVESPTGLSSLPAIEPIEQEQAMESPSLVAPSPVEQATVPEPQEQARDIPSVKSSWEALIPQSPQEQAVVSPQIVEPSVQAVAPRLLPEPTVTSPTVEAPVQRVTPKQPSKVVTSPKVTPPVKKATVPQPPVQVLESPAAAKLPANWKNSQEANQESIIPVPKANDSLADGTYLYGQSSEPGQIGKEYLVFEARQGKVVGAMYMPSSEFACFHGTLNSRQLNLTIANAYNQTALAHTIAREQPTHIAAAGGQIDLNRAYDSLSYPYSVILDSYQPIAQVSAQDRQMLNTCLSNYQEIVWNH